MNRQLTRAMPAETDSSGPFRPYQVPFRPYEVPFQTPYGTPAAGDPFRRQQRKRMFRADALAAAAWCSPMVAIALWLADGGAAGFSTLDGAVRSLGIIAGLVGMDLVILMLLLAARVPVVDRTIGHDRAMAVHKKLGKPALYLLLAHGVLLAVGYGAAEGLDPLSESVSLWVNVPDMWLAFVSMALFVAVVVTSLVAVRRRFPYEFWYAVHLLTYAAVLTSLPHQFSVGGLFAEGTWQRWYWLGICVLTAVALLFFRLWQPLASTFRHRLTVERVEMVAPDVFNIEMSGLRLHQLAGNGGRFFFWRFLTPGLWWQPHPFSLSAEPLPGTAHVPGRLRITVRCLGEGSARLRGLRPGTKVAIEGPYGVFSSAARSRSRVVMIGAGIGITPLRALLESTPFEPGQATVLLRASSTQELYLGQEILELCRERGATLFHVTGPRSKAGSGAGSGWLPAAAVQDGYRLESYAPGIDEADVYVCGPSAWATDVLADLRSAGVKEEQIHYERFDW